MDCSRIVFSGHALRRMFERDIGNNEILATLSLGEIIHEYPDDQPYPSMLMLYAAGKAPLHILVARDERGVCYIVTCYRPDSNQWQDDFKTRRTT